MAYLLKKPLCILQKVKALTRICSNLIYLQSGVNGDCEFGEMFININKSFIEHSVVAESIYSCNICHLSRHDKDANILCLINRNI